MLYTPSCFWEVGYTPRVRVRTSDLRVANAHVALIQVRCTGERGDTLLYRSDQDFSFVWFLAIGVQCEWSSYKIYFTSSASLVRLAGHTLALYRFNDRRGLMARLPT